MKRVLTILLLFASTCLYATTYYVTTSGSDEANGTTTSTPWATLAYAEAHATAVGDIIALKKGDIWSSTTPIAIKHGGSVGNPIIWDGSLWGSGDNASIRSSGNHSADYYSIVNIIACSYVTFKNITVDGNNTQCFGIAIGGHTGMSGNVQGNETNITIDGCSILNVGDGEGYCLGFCCQTWNTDISDITVQNCTFDGSDDEQLSFYPGKGADGATARTISNVLVKNNSLTNWGRRGETTGYGLQINNHIVNAVIEDNTLAQGATGLGNAMHIEANESTAGYYPTNIIVRRNTFNISKSSSRDLYIQSGQAMTVDIYSNIFISTSTTNTEVGNLLISVVGDYLGGEINIFNNTFYTRCGFNIQNDNATGNVFIVKNNILYNAGTDAEASACLFSYTAGATVHDYNAYYRSAGVDELKMIDDGYLYTSSQVLAKEANAIVGDPIFVTVGSNFHLQSSSPVIGEGVDLDLVLDYDSVSWNVTPSMGAYEYVSPILITSIIVSGHEGATTITNKGGTLQMNASITPTDATNKNISWSTISGTGTGRIISDGLLKAITDGTVIVRAMATDGSDVYDDQVITFSNQNELTSPKIVVDYVGEIIVSN